MTSREEAEAVDGREGVTWVPGDHQSTPCKSSTPWPLGDEGARAFLPLPYVRRSLAG